MVLAAGHGTRLRPLTDERPKPLVPFGDRTLLEHALDRLGPALLPAVVNAHHLSAILREFTLGSARISQVIVEPELRGTAGGVAGARAFFGAGPLVVTNADVLAAVDMEALVAATPEDGVCLAVVGAAPGEGPVGVAADGRVVRLRGERYGEEAAGGDYVGTIGIGARVLAELPERGCLIGDVAMPLARRGGSVSTVPVEGGLLAPGDGIAEYLAAHRVWLERRSGGDGASFVGEGARIEPGVELSESVIGAGAFVAGRGRVERVVAWPGARVTAPLADAVVTTAGRVVRPPPSERPDRYERSPV
ncbi:MAG TPA: sugar phosphate nucleotidyltransferase [Polyangiaceae bacterium]|nr:sugar phosphate nucleotidyltransferase [Polyangiaceae bacterium]